MDYQVLDSFPPKPSWVDRWPKWVKVSMIIILLTAFAVLLVSCCSTAFMRFAGTLEFGIGPYQQKMEVQATPEVQSQMDQASIIPSFEAPKIAASAAPITKKKNDAAPIGVEDVQEDIAQKYVTRFESIARTEMEKFGIPASISLAQGLVESRAGTSTLARRNNNHFGMKCFSKKCPKGHCSNHTDDSHKDFFRVYDNAWESWRAHSQMLATGRYASLKKYGRDYRNWAYGLKTLGYATDRNYADKLIGMIERYNLHKYDK